MTSESVYKSKHATSTTFSSSMRVAPQVRQA